MKQHRTSPGAADSPGPGALYNSVWRWHFGVGMLALPFLVLLAVTGGAYLFKAPIDHWIYRQMEDVVPRDAAKAPASKIIERVEAQMDGRVLQITMPKDRDRAARLMVRVGGGQVRTAFADPYDGRLTGSTSYGGVMQALRKIHSLQIFGFWASCLIEITAGWAVVMALGGLFLWWPRGRSGGVLSIRGRPRQRVFWRDLHAVTGLFSCGLVLFLALTGMPWSMFWGAQVQRWATEANLNEPEPPAHVTPEWIMATTVAEQPHSRHASDSPRPEMPWAMEQAVAPKSLVPTGASAAPVAAFGIDDVFARLKLLGMDPSAAIALPDGPHGAYVATWRPDRVEETRVLYLDQYSGRTLGDVHFSDWGPVGRAIEWGVAVHQGQEYGAGNRYVMLLACVSIVLLAVTSVCMWLQRRPAGHWGLPPAPIGRTGSAWVWTLALTGVIFPLVGVSLVLFLLIDRLVRWRILCR